MKLIAFQRKGLVTMDEKLTYHKSVDAFFQTNAWVDMKVSKKWIESTLSTFVKEE